MRPLRILNVAEKNDAAKELSRIMSRGQCLRVRPGKESQCQCVATLPFPNFRTEGGFTPGPEKLGEGSLSYL